STAFASDPDAHIFVKSYVIIPDFLTEITATNVRYHLNNATATASRNFHGVGPSLSWNASARIVGDSRESEIMLDWGLNAALLFGRQKADVHHQSTAVSHHGKYFNGVRTTNYPDRSPDKHRSRSVTVPNIGGFAGFTYRLHDIKLSAGYRADFFFGA